MCMSHSLTDTIGAWCMYVHRLDHHKSLTSWYTTQNGPYGLLHKSALAIRLCPDTWKVKLQALNYVILGFLGFVRNQICRSSDPPPIV